MGIKGNSYFNDIGKICRSRGDRGYTFRLVTFYLPCAILFFSACTSRLEQKEKNYSGIETQAIKDTISKLDSMVLQLHNTNPELSFKYAKTAISLARSINSMEDLSKAYNSMGYIYSTSLKDSGFYYYNRALSIADSMNLNKIKTLVLYNLAMLYLDVSNYRNAIKFLDTCIQLAFTDRNFKILSTAYCSLGLVQLETGDSVLSKTMFETAKKIAGDHHLALQYGAAVGNLASLEKDRNNSIRLLEESTNYFKKVNGTEEEMAMAFINIGNLQTNPDSAKNYYTKALYLSEKGTLLMVQLAANNGLANCYLDKGSIEKATDCILNKAIPIALKIRNNDWLGTLYDTYSDILAVKGDYKKGMEIEKKSIHFKERVFYTKNKEQIRLLTAMLDLKNKELTIKNNNFELQKKANQIRVLIIILVISVSILIIGTIVFRVFRQKAELKLKQEQITSARRIIEIQEAERTRTGLDLHDNIGYLVRIINGFFQSMDISDKKLKATINAKFLELGEHVRRISHRMSILNIDDYADFKTLVEDIINDMRNLSGIKVNYFIQDQIPHISTEKVMHISRILQELLTNSGKYAPEADINIDIACVNETLLILYKDTGPGFNQEVKKEKAIGLKSISERIKLLGGDFVLDTAIGLGTAWEISIPV